VLGTDDWQSVRFVADNLIGFPIDSLRALLRGAGVSPKEVDVLGIIQPLVWFQHAVAEALGIPKERVPSTHARYAHVGGAAIAANLLEARSRGLLRDGKTVAIYGHGGGATWYSALMRWHEPSSSG
jgi:3-oxoacyl-[acyl-carrier-protein] synthase-3